MNAFSPCRALFCFALLPWMIAAAPALSAEKEEKQELDPAVVQALEHYRQIKWVHGPTKADVGAMAQIDLPKGYRLTDAEGAAHWAEYTQNPPDSSTQAVLAPEEGGEGWFILFDWANSGYIKDDERNSIDADAILKSIMDGAKRGNQERAARGWSTIDVLGWFVPPKYDESTNNMVWGTKAQSEGHEIINYNMRYLGREGYMALTLVDSPDSVETSLKETKQVLGGFSFKPGKKYSEFRSGDKMAAYGLTALVAGGGLAVAAKAGLLQKFGKLILVGVVAVGGFIANLFRRKE